MWQHGFNLHHRRSLLVACSCACICLDATKSDTVANNLYAVQAVKTNTNTMLMPLPKASWFFSLRSGFAFHSIKNTDALTTFSVALLKSCCVSNRWPEAAGQRQSVTAAAPSPSRTGSKQASKHTLHAMLRTHVILSVPFMPCQRAAHAPLLLSEMQSWYPCTVH